MFNRTLKTVAIAAVAVFATAGASFAATAWVDHDAKVKFKPRNNSQTVNYVEEGQKVTIIAENGSWVKIKIPGKDGWVRASALDYDYAPYPVYDDYYDYGPGYGASVCLGGPLGSLCVSD
ncbi:MAG: SH3 domain-containing protein [Hyphomicrobiales bacterium]|nr:MAG: SH3 domain-containing protein [Hyphomicrobiales bacterium]